MFVAYDNAATPVIKALQQRASDGQAASQSNIGTMTALIVGVTVLALVLVVLIRLALRGLIVQPLTDAVMAFERIASGDLTQQVDATSTNEIGRLFVSIKRMQDSLATMVKAVHNGTGSIA